MFLDMHKETVAPGLYDIHVYMPTRSVYAVPKFSYESEDWSRCSLHDLAKR